MAIVKGCFINFYSEMVPCRCRWEGKSDQEAKKRIYGRRDPFVAAIGVRNMVDFQGVLSFLLNFFVKNRLVSQN